MEDLRKAKELLASGTDLQGFSAADKVAGNSASPEDAYRNIRRQMEIMGITIQ